MSIKINELTKTTNEIKTMLELVIEENKKLLEEIISLKSDKVQNSVDNKKTLVCCSNKKQYITSKS
jgi:regulator of replication initiation timing